MFSSFTLNGSFPIVLFCHPCASLLWSPKIHIIYPSISSSLHSTTQLSLFFTPSFSYHFIDYLKSILVVISFHPFLSFPLPLSFSWMHAQVSKAFHLQSFNHSRMRTHTYADKEWHKRSVKIYPDAISSDRAIDRQQYSHDRSDSPSSLSQSLCAHICVCAWMHDCLYNTGSTIWLKEKLKKGCFISYVDVKKKNAVQLGIFQFLPDVFFVVD